MSFFYESIEAYRKARLDSYNELFHTPETAFGPAPK